MYNTCVLASYMCFTSYTRWDCVRQTADGRLGARWTNREQRHLTVRAANFVDDFFLNRGARIFQNPK